MPISPSSISATGRGRPIPRSPSSRPRPITVSGWRRRAIAEKHADNHLFWLAPPEQRPPGGESFVDLRDRTVKSIDRLTEEHRGRDIVATAHGGTIRAALAHAFDLHPEAAVRFEIDNVSITLIEHFEQADPAHAWRVAFVNYMPRELVVAKAASLA
jgi:broad specificity phosphatase PhoE